MLLARLQRHRRHRALQGRQLLGDDPRVSGPRRRRRRQQHRVRRGLERRNHVNGRTCPRYAGRSEGRATASSSTATPTISWVRTRKVWNQHAYHITQHPRRRQAPEPEAPASRPEQQLPRVVAGQGRLQRARLRVDLEVSTRGCQRVDLRARVKNPGALGVPAGVKVSSISARTRTAAPRRKDDASRSCRARARWSRPYPSVRADRSSSWSTTSRRRVINECLTDNNTGASGGIATPGVNSRRTSMRCLPRWAGAEGIETPRDDRASPCRPSAISSMSFFENAGMSSGLRLVARPLSTTHSSSTTSAQLLPQVEVRIDSHEVRRSCPSPRRH